MIAPTPQQKAFLDTIAFSEIGAALLAKSDNGYNVIVGSTPTKPILFSSYADHPRKLMELIIKNKPVISTAAGRYQLLQRYFDFYRKQLGLRDFSPASQDAIALQQIKERRALADIEVGNFAAAVDKCRNIWASLPGAGYGQHEQKLVDLQTAFIQAGGRLA
ncbi:glycoside hydrolase family 24 protein [Noviherbaspirillum malthae]|uniref:glycoside hydrolase family 24 protein n=1 Tax=Noviherbaspirillum malthae TaxID=1260987 RepID=UPI00188FD8BF|nr:glycoside hydrolase family 104 protein [Noviherbaspirillum malthae]